MAKSAPFIYQRVKGALVDMISTGRFDPGDKLPSERQLAKQLGCNYHTVRKGLAILEDEQVIERRVGAGTFLRKMDKQVRRGSEGIKSGVSPSTTAKGVVGIIGPSQLGVFGTALLDHLHHQAEGRGYRINLRTVSDFGSAACEAAREFVAQGCRVLFLPVISADVSADDLWELVRPLNIPVVLARPLPGLEKYCYEKTNVFGRASFAAVEMACRYFTELGYGNIAFFGQDDVEEDLQRRVLAYTRYVSRQGLSAHIGLVGPRAQEVDTIVNRWSSMAGNLAVVCEGDEDALRLMTALHKQNLRIPEDVAILGFKNIPMAATCDPPLSTIQFDYDYVAEAMLNHAEALLQGTTAQSEGYAKQKLMIRESCGGKLRAGAKLPAIIEQAQAEHDKVERQNG
jgi:GntR family transcriptional regulator, arabinose operon transcriptional repressor